ncbi:MAG: putative rane protein [Rubritepida sp.]|nr:putative rane protein [Rubritepida sp.]
MSDRILNDRRNGLEEAFFAEHNETLRRHLVDSYGKQDRRQALAASSGIRDEAVLDRLMELNLSAETMTALTLVPLVLVAWADGSVSEMERKAVIDGAAHAGLLANSPGGALLESWLRNEPSAALVTAWKEYVRALTLPLDLDARRALELGVLDQARNVADAAGGFMGLTSRISSAEREKLTELSVAFHP